MTKAVKKSSEELEIEVTAARNKLRIIEEANAPVHQRAAEIRAILRHAAAPDREAALEHAARCLPWRTSDEIAAMVDAPGAVPRARAERATAEVFEAEACVQEAEAVAVVADAEYALRSEIRRESRAELMRIDEALLQAVETAVALARTRQEHTAGTTRRTGARDEKALDHPFPVLLDWRENLERAHRQLDRARRQNDDGDFPSKPHVGPRVGYVRVKVVGADYLKHEFVMFSKYDVLDLPAADVRRLERERPDLLEVVERA